MLTKITLGITLPRGVAPTLTSTATVTGAVTGSLDQVATISFLYLEDAPVTPPSPPDNPGGQPDPLEPDFDPAALPKLATQPTDALAVGCQTELKVAGIDYSECFVSGSWLSPLSGVSNGDITLAGVIGYNLNPRSPGSVFKVGARVQWHQLLGTQRLLVCDSYIVAPPKLTRESSGKLTLTLELGDVFCLKEADNSLNRATYCPPGLPSTGDVANSMLAWLNRPQNAPRGRTLPETVGNFYEESPHEFLQALYAPLDIDVRTSNEGDILFVQRPGYQRSNAIALTAYQCVETDSSALIQPFTTVSATGSYTDFQGVQRSSETTTEETEGFNLSDHRPWYESGMTRTRTTTNKLGDFIISQTVDVYAYVPNSRKIEKEKDGDDLPNEPPFDPCNPQPDAPGDTSFKLLSRTVTQGNYTAPAFNAGLPSAQACYYVTGTTTTTTGYRHFETEDFHLIDKGVLEYTADRCVVTPQPEDGICPRDYVHLVVIHDHEQRSRVGYNRYRLTNSSYSSWSKRGASNTVLTSQGNTEAGRWTKYQYDWSFNPATGEIKAETRSTPDDPQEAQWIRPQATDVDIVRQVTLPAAVSRFGTLEAKPLVAPLCYTIEEVDNYATRWLREQAGLADHRILAVPYSAPVVPGSPIRFTDWDGTITEGIAFSVELTQDGSYATKAVILIPVY